MIGGDSSKTGLVIKGKNQRLASVQASPQTTVKRRRATTTT